MLTVGGLFSGIGGWELGLERAGMRVLWHCEADPYARAVLERHWPGVPCYPDVRDLRGADVEPVDVLAGGFPCQDVSIVGRRVGIDGENSGLWSEYARLVGELRPRYVLVENVANLLVRGLGRVLGDLAALGYDAEWDCIPAAAVGAPHLRDRLWLVAYPAGEQHQGGPSAHERPAAEVVPADSASNGRRQGLSRRSAGDREGQAEQAHGRQPTDEGRALDDALRGRHGAPQEQVRPGRDGALDAGWWAVEPDVGRVAHGVPARVDRLRCLGNALVPQIAEWIGGRVIAFDESRARPATASAPSESPS